jgi:hypothetical protein
MKKAIELLKAAQTLMDGLENPTDLAELYAALDSTKQAYFWDCVAFEFAHFGGAKGCQQNAMIAADMTDKAKEYVMNLAEHIRLIEEEAA